MLSGELCASLLDVLLFALKILFGISPIALFSLRCRAFVKRFFGNVNFVSGIWSESLLNYASIPLIVSIVSLDLILVHTRESNALLFIFCLARVQYGSFGQ